MPNDFFDFFLFGLCYLGRSVARRPLTGVDVVEDEAVAVAVADRDVKSGRVAETPALFWFFYVFKKGGKYDTDRRAVFHVVAEVVEK